MSDSNADTPDELQHDPADPSCVLNDYLEAHQASLVVIESSQAVSVYGEFAVGERTVPYHLVPDNGFLAKSSRWNRLDARTQLDLLQARWNDAARQKLEAQLRECARAVLALAEEQELEPRSALQALQAKYELARLRCAVALDRIAAAGEQRRAAQEAKRTREAVNLSLYPESFTLAQSMHRHFIAILGPTNSGKTHVAMEHLGRARSGIYLAPLRLLALENYERLRAKNVAVSLITGEQRKLHPDATHVASTVEMLNPSRAVEVAVIDEIQLLDDRDRGAAWTAAVCGAPASTVYLLGAPGAEAAIESLVSRIGGTLEVRRLQRMVPLHMEKRPLLSPRNLQPGDVLIAFSRRDVLSWRDQVVELGFRVSAIYGNLSPEVRQAQAERFVTGETEIVVATDAIGMGLNTPARRVIFTTATKWDGESEGLIDAALAKQIAGRAGRFGEHTAGLVAGLDPETHRTIALLLRQKEEPLPTSGFFVSPSLEHLLQISAATGQTKLYALLELFTKHINVYDEFFLPANLTDQMEHARWLDLLSLSLEDRYTLSLCPISTKAPMLEKALQDWSRCRAQRRVARLDELEDPRGRNELQFLEDSCKLYTAYAWLGFRMPDTFPDEEKAQQLMQSSSERIDRLLQAQNTRHRRSFPSEREQRRPRHRRGRRY